MITLILLAIQTTVNITGARIMADVAKFGVYVEILGTLGIAIVLGIHGFHHGLGFLFSTQGAQHKATNALGFDFHGSWLAAALIAVLAPVYIFYGFESAGDIAEETKDAGRQIPRAMRHALIWGVHRARSSSPPACCSRRRSTTGSRRPSPAASRRSSPSCRAGCRTSCSC